MLDIVILAAGKGTRMRSTRPKVLHTLAGKPFISHVIDQARKLNPCSINIVVGHASEQVETFLQDGELRFVLQAEQLGTGHAVQQVSSHIRSESTILVLYGDVPLIQAKTLDSLLSKVSETSMGLLTVNLDDPSGYGRVIRNNKNLVERIVEQRDASEEECKISEINTGVMAIRGEHLLRWLPALKNSNAQGEYYLTDIIALAVNDGIVVDTARPSDVSEVMGINNRQQQAELERLYQMKCVNELMTAGMSFIDPKRFDCRGSLTAGEDCLIDVNCVIEGHVELGNNVEIGPNCYLKNMKIGDNTKIYPNCVLEDSVVESHCNIGPFARIRPGCHLQDEAKLGNFVETKKAVIGKGSKVNHLSYVGDSELGESVNIGAGAITCNYDGANKHKTVIGDGVFVGSNTAIVAPVKLGKDATIGAGSTVTRDADEKQLIISRAKQRNIDGWSRPVKNKK